MRLEIVIIFVTTFLIYNSYYDGKYTKLLLSYKKYYKMAFIIFVALCFYIMLKRNPAQGKNLLLYTNNLIKYMPIDRSSVDMLTPIFDLSQGQRSFMESFNNDLNPNSGYNPVLQAQQQRNILSGPKATKRSVSETKKKYVAYMQDWKCGQCKNKLTHTFEVDHRIRLEHGGGNDVSNLVALCRECHGQKTAAENM
jgi:HNH endonuclease